jgi:hypothetical protein
LIEKQEMVSLVFEDEGDNCRLTGRIEIHHYHDLNSPATSKLELTVKCGRYFEEFRTIDCNPIVEIDQTYEGISKDSKPRVSACVYNDDEIALIEAYGDFQPGFIGDESTQSLIGMKRGEFKYPLWKLNFEDFDETGLWIEVSKEVPNMDILVRSDEFLGLVFPEIIGSVLHRILVVHPPYEGDLTGNDTEDKWIRWAFTRIPGVPQFDSTAGEEIRIEWIDDIKTNYAKEYLSSKLTKFTLNNEEND